MRTWPQPRLRRLAPLMAAVLFVFVGASPLVPCPFLAAATKHCCPRAPAPACPLSKSFDACPFVVTDSKLGLKEAKAADAPAVLAAVSVVSLELFVRVSAPFDEGVAVERPETVDRCVRHCVFRI